MDFSWSDQQRELLDAVGRFAREQLDYDVIENDRKAIFNHEAWKKCGEFGIQGLLVPTEYGGLGQDPLTTVAALERLGYACKDNGLLFSINAHMWTAVSPLVNNGTEAQKQKFLPGLCNGTLIGGSCTLDVDGNNAIDALTDGLIIIRAMFGLTGTAVTNGAIGGGASRPTWALLQPYLNGNCGSSFAP